MSKIPLTLSAAAAGLFLIAAPAAAQESAQNFEGGSPSFSGDFAGSSGNSKKEDFKSPKSLPKNEDRLKNEYRIPEKNQDRVTVIEKQENPALNDITISIGIEKDDFEMKYKNIPMRKWDKGDTLSAPMTEYNIKVSPLVVDRKRQVEELAGIVAVSFHNLFVFPDRGLAVNREDIEVVKISAKTNGGEDVSITLTREEFDDMGRSGGKIADRISDFLSETDSAKPNVCYEPAHNVNAYGNQTDYTLTHRDCPAPATGSPSP